MDEQVKEAREYFRDRLPHIHISQIKDEVIAEFLEKESISNLIFTIRMFCLYDYLLSQGLCDVTE